MSVAIAVPEEVTRFEHGRRGMPLEVFRPAGEGPWPALLVMHEIFGLNDDIRRIARRFADAGFIAFAPDLRDGKPWPCLVLAAMQVSLGRGAAVGLVEALCDHLAARPEVTRVGAVGFCMGGGMALLLGARRRVGAAGAFYGDVPPTDALRDSAPICGGYGERDHLFRAKGQRLVRDLKAHGVPCQVLLEPNAGHSYMNQPDQPLVSLAARPLMNVAYDPEAAERAWAVMVPFFHEHLGAAG